MVPLQEVYQLAVLEQGHGRAARGVWQEMLAGLVGGIGVHTGKYGNEVVRTFGTGKGMLGTGACSTSGATAYAVHHAQYS